MRAWFRALHIRERYIAGQQRVLLDHEERVHRLEIALRQLQERQELLEGQYERLLARWKGDRGGRPPKAPSAATQLDMIPRGDKAALRAFFKTNPPVSDTTQEQ